MIIVVYLKRKPRTAETSSMSPYHRLLPEKPNHIQPHDDAPRDTDSRQPSYIIISGKPLSHLSR